MKNISNRIWILAGIALPAVLFGCTDKNATTDTMSTNSPSGAMMADTNNMTNGAMNATNMATNADNTRRNMRDRNSANATPLDQGNSQGDLDITKNIRQSLMSGANNYSVMAQNVKVITQNGKVTLRGPVANDGEKTSIEAAPKSIAGDGNVDDQLEVKSNP